MNYDLLQLLLRRLAALTIHVSACGVFASSNLQYINLECVNLVVLHTYIDVSK